MQKITLKTIFKGLLIPPLGFCTAFLYFGLYLALVQNQLNIVEGKLPESWVQQGVEIERESQDDSIAYTLNYDQQKVSWEHGAHFLSLPKANFATADVDRDSVPELVILGGGLQSNSQRYAECYQWPNAVSYPVVDIDGEGELSVSCKIPHWYSLFFQETYQSFLFQNSPRMTISAFYTMFVTFIVWSLYFCQFIAKRRRWLKESNTQ